MPQMGVSVAEGTVVEWRKQPGDWIEADEVIAAISTDKIDTDVEAPAAGRLQEIIVAEGETVDVGAVLALIATDAKPGEAHTSEGTSEADVALEAPGDAGDLPGDTDTRHANGSTQKRDKRYSPVVMRMAAEHDLDLSQIEGTGRGGRVRKQDVLAFLEQKPGRGEATSGDERSEAEPPMHIESPYKPDAPPPPKRVAAPAAAGSLSRMRQTIGRAMVESLQTAATCTTIVEADMTRVETARKALGLTSPARRSRRCGRSPRSTPRSRATRTPATTPSTSASPSRWARRA